MGFVRYDDYLMIATEEDLEVLHNATPDILSNCERIAINEATPYLSTKYDTNILFSDFEEYDELLNYKKYARIKVTTTSPDLVTYYSCIKDTIEPTSIDNTTYFKPGDDRDFKLLQVIMSISLFYLHMRLSPNNIPAFRAIAYDGSGDESIMSAIKWLNLVMSGKLAPNWAAATADNGTVEIDVDGDGDADYTVLGSNPAGGIMWGNDMGDEYFHYNNLYDKNIIRKTK
jgi:hypothetical protein